MAHYRTTFAAYARNNADAYTMTCDVHDGDRYLGEWHMAVSGPAIELLVRKPTGTSPQASANAATRALAEMLTRHIHHTLDQAPIASPWQETRIYHPNDADIHGASRRAAELHDQNATAPTPGDVFDEFDA